MLETISSLEEQVSELTISLNALQKEKQISNSDTAPSIVDESSRTKAKRRRIRVALLLSFAIPAIGLVAVKNFLNYLSSAYSLSTLIIVLILIAIIFVPPFVGGFFSGLMIPGHLRDYIVRSLSVASITMILLLVLAGIIGGIGVQQFSDEQNAPYWHPSGTVVADFDPAPPSFLFTVVTFRAYEGSSSNFGRQITIWLLLLVFSFCLATASAFIAGRSFATFRKSRRLPLKDKEPAPTKELPTVLHGSQRELSGSTLLLLQAWGSAIIAGVFSVVTALITAH